MQEEIKKDNIEEKEDLGFIPNPFSYEVEQVKVEEFKTPVDEIKTPRAIIREERILKKEERKAMLDAGFKKAQAGIKTDFAGKKTLSLEEMVDRFFTRLISNTEDLDLKKEFAFIKNKMVILIKENLK
jgi:hypothetical protein